MHAYPVKKLVNLLDRALAHGLKVAILYEVEGVRTQFTGRHGRSS